MAVVGEPLTPAVLDRMGVLKGWPPSVGEKFEPSGRWVHTYRIWTCHGYTDRGNTNRGFLRIERIPGTTGEDFSLDVLHRVLHTGDLVHELRARITCQNDEIATPVKWSLGSRFFEPAGEERQELTLRKNDAPISKERQTADWCLFESMQRRTFGERESRAFRMLEGLTVARPVQRVAYQGTESIQRDGRALKLHRFYQIGHGTLPYEYWLDEDHRLLLVASLDKAFILDPKAESKVRWRSKPAARKGEKR